MPQGKVVLFGVTLALLLSACLDDSTPPTAAQSRQWDADRRAQTARTSQEYLAHDRAVRRQEKLKQDWFARGMPPPLKGDRH